MREHFETFRAHAAVQRDGDGLPGFVEQEFRDFLRCGCLAGGFARFRCTACGLDRLVAFSCKGRGFCPRCGGRKMAERSAHLVEDVFPDVTVRQWVLSLPYRVRYQLAWDHDLCRAVVGVTMLAVLGWLRRRARLDGVKDGRGGAVAIVQRFGGALNLNVHVHGGDRSGRRGDRASADGERSARTANPVRSLLQDRLWADLMSRTFGFDLLACPRCGGRLRLVALIEQAAVIERILHHLDLPAEIPAPRPARAPPLSA